MFYAFFFKNLYIFFFIFFILAILFFLEFFYFKKLKNSIDVFSLIKLINHENAIVLDFREEFKYKKSHILNSFNMSLNNIDFHIRFLKKYKKKKFIIVFDNNYGSLNIIKILKKSIENELFYLDGGFSSWLKENMPTVSS